MAIKILFFLLYLGLIAAGYVLPGKGSTSKMNERILSKRGAILYTSGQYILAFREHDDEKVALLRRLLKTLWSSLQSVIQDLKAPNTSAAYYTFFKDAENIPFLTSLYTNITAGAPVYAPTSPPQPWAPFSPNGSPIIMVLSGKGQFSAAPNGYQEDMFDRCMNNPHLTASVPFGKKQSSPFILLCPFFSTALSPFIYGDLPPEPFYEHPAANCLTVTKRNRFKKTTNRLQPAGFDLTQYRMWILLEELAHLYYSASTGNPSIDSYDVNTCVRLSPEASLSNGPSYSYYAASVAGKCDQFPTLRRQNNGVELLEVDGHQDDDPDDPSDYGTETPQAYADAPGITDYQLAADTPVLHSIPGAGLDPAGQCVPGTCFTWCTCA